MTAKPTQTRTDAAKSCLELVRRQRHGVSFHELRAVCDRLGVPTAGDQTLTAATIPGIVLWAGMSEEFADVCAAVYRTPGVVLIPTAVPFGDDGALPAAVADLRFAKWPPNPHGYAQPRYLPAAFAWPPRLAGAPKATGSTSRLASPKGSPMTNERNRLAREGAWRRILAGEDDTQPVTYHPTTDAQRDEIRTQALDAIHKAALDAGVTMPEIDAEELEIRRSYVTDDGRARLLDVGRRYLAALLNTGTDGPPPGAEDYRRSHGEPL